MMSTNDKIQGLIEAVGSVAEMCKMFYDVCMSQGFTDVQAMMLTSQIPKAVFSVRSGGDDQ